MSDSDASDEINISVRLDKMHLWHNSPNISGKSCKNFNSAKNKNIYLRTYFSLLLLLLLCKSKKSDIVLGIRADLSETNEIDTVLLGVETRWQIVTVSLIVAVIEAKMIAKFFMLNHDWNFIFFLFVLNDYPLILMI